MGDYLGPSVGVEAGKRNKAASLDHGLRGCAHRRLRAAVAQVVLVVRKLLLSSHNYCLDICSDFESIVYQVDRIVQSPDLSLPDHLRVVLCCRSVSVHSGEKTFIAMHLPPSARFSTQFCIFLNPRFLEFSGIF